ncbi:MULTISPECIES: transposase family protein [unclassified Streptomyces]|uniref:transposase family protein n=1 Tax=unclassified Streptomyces TaxID=2593676 RepID=UPI0027E4B6F6|nr:MULTISPECIES: transposase family protein [unclassified Streptomyces]
MPPVCHRLSRQVAGSGGCCGALLAGTAASAADPRRRSGVRHPFVAVLLVAASAVIAGARSYAAIGHWSASAPQHALARLGARVLPAASNDHPIETPVRRTPLKIGTTTVTQVIR